MSNNHLDGLCDLIFITLLLSSANCQSTSSSSGCSFATGSHVYNIQLSRGVSDQACLRDDQLVSQQKDADSKVNELMYDVLQLQSTLKRMMELNNNLSRHVADMDTQLRVTREALRINQTAASDCPLTYGVRNVELRSCYMLVARYLSWYDAETYCMSTGGHLVALESQAEQQFIVDQIRTSRDLPGNHIWTGGNDIYKEDVWTWVGVNTELNHTRWLLYPHPEDGLVQNPDNHGGNEHCLHLFHLHDLEWNDQYCGQQYYFICEYKLP